MLSCPAGKIEKARFLVTHTIMGFELERSLGAFLWVVSDIIPNTLAQQSCLWVKGPGFFKIMDSFTGSQVTFDHRLVIYTLNTPPPLLISLP